MQSISPSRELANRQLIAFPSGSRGDPLLGSKAAGCDTFPKERGLLSLSPTKSSSPSGNGNVNMRGDCSPQSFTISKNLDELRGRLQRCLFVFLVPICHSNGFDLTATGNGAESATRMDGRSLSLTSGTKRTVVMLVVAVHRLVVLTHTARRDPRGLPGCQVPIWHLKKGTREIHARIQVSTDHLTCFKRSSHSAGDLCHCMSSYTQTFRTLVGCKKLYTVGGARCELRILVGVCRSICSESAGNDCGENRQMARSSLSSSRIMIIKEARKPGRYIYSLLIFDNDHQRQSTAH